MAISASSAGPPVGDGLENKLKRMVIVFVYFAFGSLFYGITEGWEPLDTCYFLIVCAFATPGTPGTLWASHSVSVRVRGALLARQDQHHGRVRRHLS